MEVLSRQEALLTNYEVLQVLKEEDERHKKLKSSADHKYPENVTTLKFEALQYLNATPCAAQSAEQIAALKGELTVDWELTKAEALQIINLRPTVPAVLDTIIEEREERLEVEDLMQLAEVVVAALPRDEGEEDE
ncbi:hypothetical protein GQ54DRAFT_249163, partial [Martensiomyces pterosporus]